jgi:hypothetical protein
MIYITFYLFGYDVWLFPNLLIDNRKFLESLNPIIGYYPRDDDSIYEILFRISFFILIITCIIFFIINPYIFYYICLTVKGFFGYIEKWGYDKLTDIHVNYL